MPWAKNSCVTYQLKKIKNLTTLTYDHRANRRLKSWQVPKTMVYMFEIFYVFLDVNYQLYVVTMYNISR